MIMKLAKYNPTKSNLHFADQGLPIRKRNHSLGDQTDTQAKCSPTLSPDCLKSAQEIVYTSRKNIHLLKANKLKNLRFSNQGTKICHESILQYNLLKRRVTEKISPENNDQSPNKILNTPKLSIKNLRIGIQHQFFPNRRNKTEVRRLETEAYSDLRPRRRSNEELSPIKAPVYFKKHQRHSVQLPTKKYNQLSLREIAEVEQLPRLNILKMLRQWKTKDQPKRQSRKPSEDFMLEGW